MKYTFFATAGRGLEDLVAKELQEMGIKDAKALRGGARFTGSLEDGYRATLWSRMASTILLSLSSFKADSNEAVYNGVRRIPWDEHLSLENTFAISTTSTRANLNTHFISLKAKDAIVDQFRKATQERPNVDVENPDLAIQIHVDKDLTTVYLDLGNPGLHKRGYRVLSTDAPIRETVAASILVRGGWPELAKQGAAFMDPMCGSGTFVIEAAMMAADIAPGLGRVDLGFDRWKKHDQKAFSGLLQEAQARRDKGLETLGPIHGTDVAGPAIAAARRNAEAAGLAHHVHLERVPLMNVRPPAPTGLVATNPPYGHRFEEDAAAVHYELGEALINEFIGWKAAIITGSKELGRELGMRAIKTFNVDNGPLRCIQINFDIQPERIFHERR